MRTEDEVKADCKRVTDAIVDEATQIMGLLPGVLYGPKTLGPEAKAVALACAVLTVQEVWSAEARYEERLASLAARVAELEGK